jgi:hypothetical protein
MGGDGDRLNAAADRQHRNWKAFFSPSRQERQRLSGREAVVKRLQHVNRHGETKY